MLKRSPIFTCLLFLLLLLVVQASHIVGGEMAYKFVERKGSKVRYHIMMKIFRDVYFSDPTAPFDSFANISVHYNTFFKRFASF